MRAYEAAMRRIYPLAHPLHRLTGAERIARVEALDRAISRTSTASGTAPRRSRSSIVGDVDAERVLDRLEAGLGLVGARTGPGHRRARRCRPPSPGSETVRLADKANADVVLALPSDLTRTDPDFLACSLANAALGQSSLTSRLGVRVRDTEGLTYGIHSSFSATHVAGPFVVSLTVKPESREAALAATLDEIRKYVAGGMTEKELAEEKSSRIGRFKVDLGSNAGIAAGPRRRDLLRVRGRSYLDEFPAKVAAVTREQADAAFARARAARTRSRS